MSKGLEALKRIRQETCPATYIPDFDKEECCNIIEKELKEYEQLKQLKLLPYPQENGEQYRQDVIKRLMALEIIKQLKCFSFYEIDNQHYISGIGITKEKYELLKEVLLCH